MLFHPRVLTNRKVTKFNSVSKPFVIDTNSRGVSESDFIETATVEEDEKDCPKNSPPLGFEMKLVIFYL